MDRLEIASKVRDYITDYIKFADAKAGAVLGLCMTVAGLLAAVADKFVAMADNAPVWLVGSIGVAALLLIVATTMVTLNCLAALAPRTNSTRKSLVSFPDIAKDAEWFLSNVCSLDSSTAAAEYEKHACELSTIASAKFADIANAVWWLRLQIFGAYIAGALYVVAKAITIL